MKRRLSSAAIACYVLLCITLGGSAQGTWRNLALQLIGLGFVTWSAVRPPEPGAHARAVVTPYVLGTLALLLLLIQLVPAPPSVWTSFPGRSSLAAGFAALHYPLPAQPISESPYLSVLTLFSAIPFIACFVAVDKLQPDPRWIAAAVIAGMMLGILLGAFQISSGPTSWAYLYPLTNHGAIGFFANRNHMATLLLVGIPMIAALLASLPFDRRSVGAYGAGAALLIVVAIGILLNGSAAAFALFIPVLLASVSVIPHWRKWNRLLLALSAVTVVGGLALLIDSPVASADIQSSTSVSVTPRMEIWTRTARAIVDTFPLGTGLGSFEQIYPQYEDPARVSTEYVNHAHNDYLELVLELGAPGLFLIIAFLFSWGVAAVRIWSSRLSTPFSRAGTIVSATVLAHSLVDFPLRTSAISAIFGASLGLMARHLGSSVQKNGEVRPTRHVRLR